MYEFLKDLVLEVLRCPKTPPEPPAGSHASVQIFRAARSYLAYRLLHLFIGLVSVYIGLIAFALFELPGLIAIIVALGPVVLAIAGAIVVFIIAKAVFLYVVTRLDYDMRFYVITDRSLRIREGVLVIRETTLTFANIQNLRIEQGPIQRLFGIHDLVVETAGGGGGTSGRGGRSENAQTSPMHQGVFRGLKKPEELRDLIFSYLRSVRTSGLGDQDDFRGAAIAMPQGATEPATVDGRIATDGVLFTPEHIQALRAIRDELAAWRKTLEIQSA